MNPFIVGAAYTRIYISSVVGGETVPYLPEADGRIVCGCFIRKLNPNAPYEILPGNGSEILRKALLFRQQKEPVPVFLKKSPNNWVYVGMFRVTKWSEDPVLIAEKNRVAKRQDISMVLTLAAVSS
jgi:hypothetical protein